MNTSNDLLHLIEAMTRQEKRYFKLYAAFYNKSDGNYALQLFDTIDRHKPADDTELVPLLRDRPYVRRLASVKNQLTELVLDSLAAFHASRLASFKIRRMLTHADILYNKGLYRHCRKLLGRAERKAIETEYYDFLPEIFTRRRSLLLKEVSDSFEEAIDELYVQNDIAMSTLARTNSYLKLMDFMQMIAARYATRPTEDDMQTIRALAGHPLLQDAALAETFDARLARLSTLGTYSLLVNDIGQATVYYRQAVLLWKQHPALIEERSAQYRRYLLNYLNCLLPTSDEEEFATAIRDIKTLPFPFPEQEPVALGTIWNIQLLYYLNRGHVDRCAEVIAGIEKDLARYIDCISPTTYITLCHNCTIFYFLTGRYGRALEYINNILNERRIEIKRDLHDFARVLSLVTHYELHNIDILDNMVRSAKRFLQQRESVGGLEQVVLRAIRDILFSVDEHSLHRVFHSLYSKLAHQLHSTEGPEPPGLPELLFWTESKLRRQPVRTIFTEKMKTGTSAAFREMFPVEAVFAGA